MVNKRKRPEKMDDNALATYLNKIGKECFIDYFAEFDSTATSKDVAAKIQSEKGYTLNSCRTRISKARSIIASRRADDAFRIIMKANVDVEVQNTAQGLLQACAGRKKAHDVK